MSPRHHVHVRRAGRFLPPFGQEFVSVEALSGLALLGGTLVALVWANLAGDSYRDVWHHALTLGLGDAAITLEMRHWVSDGLMTFFFFVVGLEIKREFIDGELRHAKTAALPVVAAIGGMVVPAALFVAINTAAGTSARGWAVPMATDIAFALGVLAVLGARVPRSARIFLLTLAIVDDIGAIVVIAIFYARGFEPIWLVGALAAVLVVLGIRHQLPQATWIYAAPGIALWVCLHESGVHATIAGVVLGLLIPAIPGRDRGPLERIEDAVHPWSSFLIVPLFAIASAGIALTATALERASTSTVAGGIAVGLVIGKPVGIVGATLIALRTRTVRLPTGMNIAQVAGIGAIAGIGFTVSLFVANLTYDGARLGEAKIGILAASIIAGAIGITTFARRGSGATPQN